MNTRNKYITKTELEKRWSKSLVCKDFPIPTCTKQNPYGGNDVCLYDMDEILRIESLPEFIADLRRINEQRTKQKSRPIESHVLF